MGVDELVARYRALAADDEHLTVVFDPGQGSTTSFAHLHLVGLHFVGLHFAGSLPPSEHPELLALPAPGPDQPRRGTLRWAHRLRDPH